MQSFSTGDVVKLWTGPFAGCDVFVLHADPSKERFSVALAVFGGIDHKPFNLRIEDLDNWTRIPN